MSDKFKIFLLRTMLIFLAFSSFGCKEKKDAFPVEQAKFENMLIGESAPDFRLESLNGDHVHLANQQGKVVLISFWATWCSPCQKELPHLQKIYNRYRKKGVIVLAISIERKDTVRYWVESSGYTFPVLFADKDIQLAYKVRGIPAIYLIDRNGVIQFHRTGYTKGDESKIEKEVNKQI